MRGRLYLSKVYHVCVRRVAVASVSASSREKTCCERFDSRFGWWPVDERTTHPSLVRGFHGSNRSTAQAGEGGASPASAVRRSCRSGPRQHPHSSPFAPLAPPRPALLP